MFCGYDSRAIATKYTYLVDVSQAQSIIIFQYIVVYRAEGPPQYATIERIEKRQSFRGGLSGMAGN